MKRIPHYETYYLNAGEKNVLLNITVGFGHRCSTQIYKDNVLINTVKDSIKDWPIGKNIDLVFVKMRFVTVITNEQPKANNKMSYQFGLKGGVKASKLIVDEYTATHSGETLTIDTQIDLF